jgi:hypothetical protein
MAAVEGLGVAFLSRWSVQCELALGRLRMLAIADLQVMRHFSWALPTSDLYGLPGLFLQWARRHPPMLRNVASAGVVSSGGRGGGVAP